MTESRKPTSLNLTDLENRAKTLSKPDFLGLSRRSLDETLKKPSKLNLGIKHIDEAFRKQSINDNTSVGSSGFSKPFSLNLNKSSSENPKSNLKIPIFQGTSASSNVNSQKKTRFNIPENQKPQKNNESDSLNARLRLVILQNGKLRFGQKTISTDVNSFDNLGQIGFGTCGQVFKMKHRPTNAVMAIKQMARTGNPEENKRIMMDLEVVQQSHDCPHIVTCFGTFVTESHFWICMELMETCFDKLKKKIGGPMPENIIGKLSVSVVKALHYLKEKHDVIHRDVKPSNILVSRGGQVKLCDFGISGRLVDSKAKTRNAGCVAYMAPERISPDKVDYDIRADVWSLGISLIELATGSFPYSNCQTDFEMLTRIIDSEPPTLPNSMKFSMDFRRFVNLCCTKSYEKRPKYRNLLGQEFIARYERTPVDIGGWLTSVLKQDSSSNDSQSFVQKKSSTLPRLGSEGFSLSAFATKEDKKEDPFSFANNITAHFVGKHTRNRSWAASFDFLKPNTSASTSPSSSTSSSSLAGLGQKTSSSSSLQLPR